MRKGSTRKLIGAFSIGVFLIVMCALVTFGLFSGLLFRMGIFDPQPPGEPEGPYSPIGIYIFFGLFSVVISMVLARYVARRYLTPIVRMGEAATEIARGNYEVRIEEKIPFLEVREMAENFNTMARELQNTETFRADFIANVSHEFKTPISVIEGYAMLLQNQQLSDEEREDYIQRVLINTKRLSSLSGNILLLSSLEHQNIKPAPREFALDEQIRQIILFLEPEWTAKELNLDIELESVSFYGNRSLLIQVWQNLIDNAVKFSPQGETVGVSLKREGDMVVVSISDKGPGMSMEVRERMFEKFYQGDQSHSTAGNGLGLTLAKRIVDLHEGTIEVTSMVGMGANFTVRLPIKNYR